MTLVSDTPLMSCAPLAVPEPKESGVVEVHVPPQTTPQQVAEPTTAPLVEGKSELKQVEQLYSVFIQLFTETQ